MTSFHFELLKFWIFFYLNLLSKAQVELCSKEILFFAEIGLRNHCCFHLFFDSYLWSSYEYKKLTRELSNLLNTTIFALTAIVYLYVLVFRINKHDGWKLLIYEIQIKKIHYLSSSRWNGRQCLDRALQIRTIFPHIISELNSFPP